LSPEETAGLLRGYGIPLVTTTRARTEDDAVTAANAAGYPVAVKADVPGLVHKTEAGAVRLDLRSEDAVRSAYRGLAGEFGVRLSGVIVQPMVTGGTEVIIGVRDEAMFGPLVVFGLGDGAPAADLAALRDALMRVSRLADDLPVHVLDNEREPHDDGSWPAEPR
jgi:acyl-CoA synthetase (NDP forming)